MKNESRHRSNRSTGPFRDLPRIGFDLPRPKISTVYFIHCPAFRAIKIGFGTDAKIRLANFQVGCPAKLVLLGVCRGGRKLETELHKRFGKHCIRGEWFRCAPDMIAEIIDLIDKDKHIFPTGEFIQL